MSVKTIKFNDFSFQDSNWRTKNIIYRNLPDKNIDIEPNTRRDGFRVVNTYYDKKDITIAGTLTSDTEADLRTMLDSMKKALHINEAALDIDEGGNIIRYICSVESIGIPEEHYHITQIPYRISFRCQPFGYSTSSIVIDNSFSASPFSSSFDPIGSAPPLPILRWTCSSVPTTTITQITFNNITTGDSITVPNLVLNTIGSYLKIDIDKMLVLRSYSGGAEVPIDFTGVFPRFSTSSNTYNVTISGGGATWALTQRITYFPAYL